jgi:hypothetical protein
MAAASDAELESHGYVQTWLTIHEQMEQAQGLYQHPSGDAATASTTGFRIARARVGATASFRDGAVVVVGQLRLERSVGLLDLYTRFAPEPWLTLQLGQFKFPSAYENLQDNRALDFIERTQIADALSDYAISRTVHASSLFAGNRSMLRDLGFGVKAEWFTKQAPLRIFLMVGNGLGANLFIGGETARESVITNELQFFYGARLETEPFPGFLKFGMHASYNRHDDMVLNSGRAVADLDRPSASGDVTIGLPENGARVTVMHGRGAILEDFDGNGKADYRYGGWEAKLVWRLDRPLAACLGAAALGSHGLELAVRWDLLNSEADESGVRVAETVWTAGASYYYADFLKIQLNSIVRRTAHPHEPDLKDDAWLLNVQMAF